MVRPNHLRGHTYKASHNRFSLASWVATNSSRPVYGPPGAQFDGLGNLYYDRGNHRKEWIAPYRDHKGEVQSFHASHLSVRVMALYGWVGASGND